MFSETVLAVVSWYMQHISYFWVVVLMAVESSFIPFPSEKELIEIYYHRIAAVILFTVVAFLAFLVIRRIRRGRIRQV